MSQMCNEKRLLSLYTFYGIFEEKLYFILNFLLSCNGGSVNLLKQVIVNITVVCGYCHIDSL